MTLQSHSRVLIADSQPVFGHGLRRLLEEAGGFEVVAQTADPCEAVQLSARRRPNLAFLDGVFLNSNAGVLADVVEAGAGPKVILWAPDSDAGGLLGAVRLGARGILARTAPLRLAEKAARCVIAGQYWIGREAVGDMVRWLREIHLLASSHTGGPRVPGPQLTRREREIVSAVAAGRCNKEIAARLSVSEDTVRHHLSSIFEKVGVSSRLELAVVAMQKGQTDKTPAPGA